MTDALVCSARGCRDQAAWELLWNNPKLHDAARRKSWLACDQHRGGLVDFLAARSFLREVGAVSPATGRGTGVGSVETP